ncbi:glycoside hydrolase family 5 protein [uncultured Dokdonia sp.]|uniref:glycoside hydrolase family 5 protein n=1 Tax=uncultured Dokdonia sp. TaxID=575653 RepID=UPI002628133D|nr:glycoside hydrolase family 5 protein [uncultured Dokdonia sp.]
MKNLKFKAAPYLILTLILSLIFACSNSEPEIVFISSDSDGQQEEQSTDDDSGVEEIAGVVRDISSFELVSEMGVGWNLGNSFDVEDRDKTLWNNPLPSQEIIDQVSELGFKTLRIPVTWDYHLGETAPYVLEEEYLDEVQKIVNYGLLNDMFVILDTHHEESWAGPVPENFDEVSPRMSSLWTQIAERFKNYGDKLIFEPLNEPRVIGSPNEWSGGTAAERTILNDLHRVCQEAIRATGGNNTNRHLLISTYAASTVPSAMDDLVIPNNDSNVIISLHAYFPFLFALEGQESWGTESDREDLRQEFDRIRNKWIVEEQRPIILGEWGAVVQNSLPERLDYAEFYVTEALERDLLPIVWDDGGNFILLNRFNLFWPNLQVAETIIEAANN